MEYFMPASDFSKLGSQVRLKDILERFPCALRFGLLHSLVLGLVLVVQASVLAGKIYCSTLNEGRLHIRRNLQDVSVSHYQRCIFANFERPNAIRYAKYFGWSQRDATDRIFLA